MSKKIKAAVSDMAPKKHKYELNDFEVNYIDELSKILAMNIYKDAVISSFLTYVAVTRFAYTKVRAGYHLKFDVQLDNKLLYITEERDPEKQATA